MAKSKTQDKLVLSFNETTWELKLFQKNLDFKIYEVYLNGKKYKKIKVKLSTFPVDDYNVMTNVHIYKNDEYQGNTYFKNNNVNLDEMIDIIKWVKFYGENKF